MKAYYRKATFKDGLELAKKIREEDLQEIQGLGHGPESIPFFVLLSDVAVALFDGDELAGIGGITPDPTNEGAGLVWLLCTPIITRKPQTVVRGAMKWLKEHEHKYTMLWNLADARNTYHHKLLRLLGFKGLRQLNIGPFFLPYIEIVKLCASQ
jgi:hypothetical protein